jgi:hypothetical protein
MTNKTNYKFLKFMNSKQELIFQKDQIGTR